MPQGIGKGRVVAPSWATRKELCDRSMSPTIASLCQVFENASFLTSRPSRRKENSHLDEVTSDVARWSRLDPSCRCYLKYRELGSAILR